MFNVVIGDNWYSVVPESGVDVDRKLCMWPPHGINMSKAVKKLLSSQASWNSVPYKYLLGLYGKKNNI